MSLDDLTYLVNALAIIIPGFIFIKIFDRSKGYNPYRENFELIIWSSFVSIVAYLIASNINEHLSDYFGFDHLIMTLFAVFLLLFIACLLAERFDAFNKLRRFISFGIRYEPNYTIWDTAISGYYEFVIVYTSDGLKYGGQILLSTNGLGKNGEPIREIFLHEPVILNNDIELHELEKNLQGVLLLENDIRRIEFLGKIKYQTI